MLKPNRVLTAVAGFAAAGALVFAASSAAAAPTAGKAAGKAAGKNAYTHTTDKAKSGKIKWYHNGDKLRVCDSRKGYYAHGSLYRIAGSGSHETWTKVATLNANNKCVTKAHNTVEGGKVAVHVVNKKKGSSKEYSKSGFAKGRA